MEISRFEIPIADGISSTWLFWRDFPHVSVLFSAQDLSKLASNIWRDCLLSGLERSLKNGVYRVFLLFEGPAPLQSLRTAFQSDTDFEVLPELRLSVDSCQYKYVGLDEVRQRNPLASVEIVTLNPTRVFQAKNFNLFEEREP